MEGIVWGTVITGGFVILIGLAIIAMSGCRANEPRPGFDIGNGYYVKDLRVGGM